MFNSASAKTECPRAFSVDLLPSQPLPVSVYGIAPFQMQDPVLHHAELPNVPVSPFLQTVQVLPKTSLLTSPLDTPCNLTSATKPWSALHPIAQTIHEDSQQYRVPQLIPAGQHRRTAWCTLHPLGPAA